MILAAVLESLILLYFVYVVSYAVVFSVAGRFYTSTRGLERSRAPSFCLLIPCYKEDSVILEVAKEALKQSYAQANYHVIIIADALQAETLRQLRLLPIAVIEVKFENSTKVKALQHALRQLQMTSDFAVVLDADNVMHPDFLARMSSVLSQANPAVQGQRKAKNTDNSLALLDAVSEAINNHIYRQGTASLGLSASISGSGFAVEFERFKRLILSMDSIGGFDRELEILLLLEGVKVGYHREAIVFDEKVSQTQVFRNQRRRWISSQYVYLAKYWGKGISALVHGQAALFNSAVLRNIQLPRLINIGLLGIIAIASFFLRSRLYWGFDIWMLLLVLHTAAIFLAIPNEFYERRLLIAMLRLPSLFANMVGLFLKLKGANKKFAHTPHGPNSAST